MNSNEMIDVDLPSLRSFQLGACALCGCFEEGCSLTMRSKYKRFEITEYRSSKSIFFSQLSRRQFLFSSCSDIGKYFWILNIDSLFRYSKSSVCRISCFILSCTIEIHLEYCLLDFISFIDVARIFSSKIKSKPFLL